jgi:uncharacterized protein (TIGR02145 family)
MKSSKKIALMAILAFATAFTVSCSSSDVVELEVGKIVDERSYDTYNTVVIGNQEWMAENLKYDVGRCYNDLPTNCNKYGQLYDWATAMGISSAYNETRYYNDDEYENDFEPIKGICPKGWHIPTDGEWNTLINAVGGLSKSAAKLKIDSKLWDNRGGGTNDYGFAALPGGYAYYSSASNSSSSSGSIYLSDLINKSGTWWSITESNPKKAFVRRMDYDADFVSRLADDKSKLFSIRCVRGYNKGSVNKSSSSSKKGGSSSSNIFEDTRDSKVYRYVTVGSQIWMAENLDYRGDKNSVGVCYNKKYENCDKYGRLYNYETAQTVCPSGWELPTENDWLILLNNAGNSNGEKLKAASGWEKKGNGTDDYGFAALPGGYGLSSKYNADGVSGVWWSATETDASSAVNVYINNNSKIAGWDSQGKEFLFSVRCIKN